MRVAFQGERGAYSEAAAMAMFGPESELAPCASFDDVFALVAGAEVDRGIIPIENTLGGSVHQNYDLLLRNELYIVNELMFRVSHCLIGLSGMTKADVKRVYSHWQALAQCEGYLDRLGAERIATYDTAGSVRMVKDEARGDTAAIASKRAAEFYGLHVIEEGIEDDNENYTRFLGIGRTPNVPHDAAKTSIVFSVPNGPGALFKALGCFALRDVDLTKIESRPLKGSPWEYLFFADFIGRPDDGPGLRALNHLRETATFLRVLGAYAQAD